MNKTIKTKVDFPSILQINKKLNNNIELQIFILNIYFSIMFDL